jgi:cyanophycin synthetase
MSVLSRSAAFAPAPPEHHRPARLLEWTVYRGPHLFSARPMIRMQLDLGALEEWPTDRLPCFTERLLAMLPGLADHGCSYRAPLGFVKRLHQGTWLGHVIEHVALELQKLAGSSVTRGKTRSVKGRPGVYNILFQYREEEVGIAAGLHAIRLVGALLPDAFAGPGNLRILGPIPDWASTDIEAVVSDLEEKRRRSAYGPTTQALVDEAARRYIPVTRLNDGSLVQLGYGSRQKRLRASITGDTSQIGVDIAGDKDQAKRLLTQAGLPAPRGAVVRTAEDAAREARRLGWPVVVKPLDGNHGRGVTLGIDNEEKLGTAFAVAQKISRRVIVEQQLVGSDHRLLVIGGKLVAVAERVPAHVVGDGASSIQVLIDAVNLDPRRGAGHEKVLTRIVPDEAVRLILKARGLTLESVPGKGETVWLRDTANLSTGGTAIDRTDDIHPYNRSVAEQAAAVVGLDVCGIDFLCPDITRPVSETGGGIVEVNAAPGFRMHLEPSSGTPRDVARPVLDLLFPRGRSSRIPIFAITGTNGKSTTARMVARILRERGDNVGMTTTTGVYFNEHLLKRADASGPKSARMVLANAAVDAAVLETARGGILREGLGFDYADVGAVLNVTADHLGIKGIDTIEDLADVKGVVTESVARRGHSVLNADDPMCERVARHARGTIVWFSLLGGAPISGRLKRHVADGGMAVVREPGRDGGTIVLHRGGERIVVIEAAAIPATLGGIAEFNIANACAAIAMCAAQGVALESIRAGLAAFTTSFEDSPGRMNVHDAHGMRIIMDYAHNPAGLTALGRVIEGMRHRYNRVLGMVSIPGDRRNDDIMAMGRIAAGLFDEVVFREAPDGRGRVEGEVNSLMSHGAIEAGMSPSSIHRILKEEDAVESLLRSGRPGDLIVLLPSAVDAIWRMITEFEPNEAVAVPLAAELA